MIFDSWRMTCRHEAQRKRTVNVSNVTQKFHAEPTDVATRNNSNPKNSNLCDTCNGLGLASPHFISYSNDGQNEDEKVDLGLVKDIKAKQSHCPLCRLLLRALEPSLPDFEDGEPVYVSINWSTENRSSEDPLFPTKTSPTPRIMEPIAETRAFVGGDPLFPRDGLNMFPGIVLVAEDIPDTTSSYSGFARLIKDKIDFDMARGWLAICKNQHAGSCDQPLMNEEIMDPAREIASFRLIDVVDKCIVRPPLKCEYAALSYIWGSIQTQGILRTLKENMEVLETPGAFLRPEIASRIPLTIQHAMDLLSNLQMRYLWVDSLCIIQDDDGSTGSKMENISKMNIVYGAAYFTIEAATGTDANAGLPGLYAGSRQTSQVVEEVLPGLRLALKDRSSYSYWESRYYTRGWTFQERKYSKRTLRFINGQNVFSCRSANELREDIFCEDNYSKSIFINSYSDVEEKIAEGDSLIGSYSALSLTFSSDIYHAFAGFTTYFKRNLLTSLCHGMPNAYFDWFFLWSFGSVRRPGGPSWSWSGWHDQATAHTLIDWDAGTIDKAGRIVHRKRTWIIWYQRVAHESRECIRVWTPDNREQEVKSGTTWTNFYGIPSTLKSQFPFDCSRTLPTPCTLIDAPKCFEDNHTPPNLRGSGYLQFWTVSAIYRVAPPTKKKVEDDSKFSQIIRLDKEKRLAPRALVGIYDQNGREITTILVPQEWYQKHIVQKQSRPSNQHHDTYEFILLCEGMPATPESPLAEWGDGDGDGGKEEWKYMIMLIEWHGQPKNDDEFIRSIWAERVAVGAIDKKDLNGAFEPGLVEGNHTRLNSVLKCPEITNDHQWETLNSYMY